GEFIRLSIETRGNLINTIEYDYDIEQKQGKEYFYFKNDQIDQNLKSELDKEMSEYRDHQYNQRINFKEGMDASSNIYDINYVVIDNKVVLNIGLKTLFYSILSAPSVTPLSKFSSL